MFLLELGDDVAYVALADVLFIADGLDNMGSHCTGLAHLLLILLEYFLITWPGTGDKAVLNHPVNGFLRYIIFVGYLHIRA